MLDILLWIVAWLIMFTWGILGTFFTKEAVRLQVRLNKSTFRLNGETYIKNLPDKKRQEFERYWDIGMNHPEQFPNLMIVMKLMGVGFLLVSLIMACLVLADIAGIIGPNSRMGP